MFDSHFTDWASSAQTMSSHFPTPLSLSRLEEDLKTKDKANETVAALERYFRSSGRSQISGPPRWAL